MEQKTITSVLPIKCVMYMLISEDIVKGLYLMLVLDINGKNRQKGLNYIIMTSDDKCA